MGALWWKRDSDRDRDKAKSFKSEMWNTIRGDYCFSLVSGSFVVKSEHDTPFIVRKYFISMFCAVNMLVQVPNTNGKNDRNEWLTWWCTCIRGFDVSYKDCIHCIKINMNLKHLILRTGIATWHIPICIGPALFRKWGKLSL